MLARRRGTDPNRRARSADELALLLDRAGDLTREELNERVSDQPGTGNPIDELLSSGRVAEIAIPAARGADTRFVLVESLPRYLSAFGGDIQVPESVPAPFRSGSLTQGAARREILARFLALAGPVTVVEILERYVFVAALTERRLSDLMERGTLMRGRFSLPGYESALRWCSRRLIEQARRRALAAARKQVEAVALEAFALFMQRWRISRRTRASPASTASPTRSPSSCISRPPLAWESAYLPARVEDARLAALSQMSANGELVWIGKVRATGSADRQPARRSFREARHRACLAGPVSERGSVSVRGCRCFRPLLQTRGALFFF